MARTASSILAAILTVTLALGANAFGQGGRGYDPATVETVRGEIVAVNRAVPRPGGGAGVHLQLRADGGTLTVRLGPAWWVDEQKLDLKPGDAIEVTGSRVAGTEPPALVAATVRKGERLVRLRDESGVPQWRGRGGPRRGSDARR